MLPCRAGSHSTGNVLVYTAIAGLAGLSVAPHAGKHLQVEHLLRGKRDMSQRSCDKEARMLRLAIIKQDCTENHPGDECVIQVTSLVHCTLFNSAESRLL